MANKNQDIKGLIKEELTPNSLRCTIGNCPAVYRTTDNKLLLIGKMPSAELRREINHKIGSDEDVVVIDEELLANIISK